MAIVTGEQCFRPIVVMLPGLDTQPGRGSMCEVFMFFCLRGLLLLAVHHDICIIHTFLKRERVVEKSQSDWSKGGHNKRSVL